LLAGSLEFWFRKKYNLPPTDPRFLDATLEDIALEYWAYQYDKAPNLDETEFEDDDFDLQKVLAENEQNVDEWEEVDLNDNQNPGSG
jgi:hypothetical protein